MVICQHISHKKFRFPITSRIYQVKEALEIKRSRLTYFQKSKTNRSKYNKATIRNMTKVEIERTDTGFIVFKNVRGTTPYFEGKKSEVFAMIRQMGPPNVFFHQISK